MKKQILTIVILTFVISTYVTGSIPKTLSYQGVVTDSNGNPKNDGKYDFVFSIYDDSVSGKSLWSEEKTIQTKQGLFSTELGSVEPLTIPFDTQYWLQVEADGTVFPQRTKLTGAPYSFRADTAEVAKKADTAVIAKGLVDSFYTREQLKTSGEAKVHADNIVNAEWLDGNPFNQDLNTTDRVKFDGVINQNAGVSPYHYRSVASKEIRNPSNTGTMKITMPQSWSKTMLTIKIAGYDYGAGRGEWECVVGGYNYTSGWVKPTCELRGNAPFSNVRLAYDGTKCCLLLGNTSTTWSYPNIHITDVITGHSNYSGWSSGWSIDLITDESDITDIATPDVDRPWHSGNLDISKFSLKTDFNPDYFVQGENSFRRCNFDSSTQLDSNIFSTFLRLDANDPSSPDNAINYGIRSAHSSTHTIEIIGRANSGNLYFGGLDGGIRKPWRTIWHSGNLNPETQSSDIRFKTDIDSINDPLKKVKSLKGISFNWKHSDFPDRHFPEGRQIGVIAQEVEKILPEVIRTDKDGYKSVAYDKLSAILIEAVKEQQKIIENQHKEIEKHEDKIAYQKTEIDSIKNRFGEYQKESENSFKELEKFIYTIKSDMEKK